MAVGKMKVQCVPPDDRDVRKGDIVRHSVVFQHLFPRPLVDAAGTRAVASQICGTIRGSSAVRPFYRNLRIIFLDYLGWFNSHNILPMPRARSQNETRGIRIRHLKSRAPGAIRAGFRSSPRPHQKPTSHFGRRSMKNRRRERKPVGKRRR